MAVYRCTVCDTFKDNDYDPVDDMGRCGNCNEIATEAQEYELQERATHRSLSADIDGRWM